MFNSFATPRTVARQAPLSVGFSRQEYWSELLFPSPGDLPNPGIKPVPPAWLVDSLPLNHQGGLILIVFILLCIYLMATHSSVLAWRTPWTEEPGGLQPTGSQSQTRLSDYTHTHTHTHLLTHTHTHTHLLTHTHTHTCIYLIRKLPPVIKVGPE